MNKRLTDFNEHLVSAAGERFPGRILVMGEGDHNASIMLVGEAPGAEEEKLKRPFVGKAGKNLTRFLDTVGMERDCLYITNVVKIRPYKISPKTGRTVNRPPSKEELEFFSPLLRDEIEAVEPKLIVTLGNTPLRAVTGIDSANIGDYHGEVINVGKYRVFPLYHPAAVIYNRKLEHIYSEDMGKIKKFF